MRLIPEFTPYFLQGRSIYRSLRSLGLRTYWENTIREDVLERASHICEICGSREQKRLTCHEVWQYDWKEKTATISCLQTICQLCNFSIHIGKAYSRYAGIDDWKLGIIICHIAYVNHIGFIEVKEMINEAFRRELAFDDESAWQIGVSPSIIKAYPRLRGISL